MRAGPGEFLFITLKYISVTINKFELSEAFFMPILKKKLATTDASYSVLTKRTKEISAVVEGITPTSHACSIWEYRQAVTDIQRRGLGSKCF